MECLLFDLIVEKNKLLDEIWADDDENSRRRRPAKDIGLGGRAVAGVGNGSRGTDLILSLMRLPPSCASWPRAGQPDLARKRTSTASNRY